MSSPGILILSAPSGAGKTSLARSLVESFGNAGLTVSHTTRAQRPGEVDGQHYHFVDKNTFESMIEDDGFIEYALVFDNYYGTSVKAIEALIFNGKHAILDIDWQGARNVRKKFPQAKSCFIMPPSVEALELRLRQRQQDSNDVIRRRMRDAKNEMSHKNEYDHVIVNDNFDVALLELHAILSQIAAAS